VTGGLAHLNFQVRWELEPEIFYLVKFLSLTGVFLNVIIWWELELEITSNSCCMFLNP
jgi:hypothetical protein